MTAPPCASSTTSGSADYEALERLASDIGDDLEVLSRCRTVRPASSVAAATINLGIDCAMLAPVGQECQDLDSSVLDRWSQVLYRHRRHRRPAEPGPYVGGISAREPDLQPGHRGDPHQASFDPARLLSRIGACC